MPTPKRQLGKRPPRLDPRTPRLEDYRLLAAAAPPPAAPWHTHVPDWGVMGNEEYGNCVIVTAAHMILLWRANELADTKRISDGAVIELSREMGALDGYIILDRLRWWRRQDMWAHALWHFASVDPKNRDAVKACIAAFGCADIGLALPIAWQKQAIWDTGIGRDYRPGSWGLHSVPLVGYEGDTAYCATWGKCQPITFDAIVAYSDEAYACIAPDWFAGDATAPSGYDLPRLRRDIDILTHP